jgi:hypothetical protein
MVKTRSQRRRHRTFGSLVQMTKTSIMLCCAIVLAAPSFAHHSGAMFDHDSSITLNGTVKDFQWTNPHCWIQVLVPGQGEPVEWSVEMAGPGNLIRGGWRPGTLKPGDRISVVIHPMRDGTPGGLFVSASDAAGKPIGKQ